MTTFRIQAEFDLLLEDDEAARAFAKRAYVGMTDQALLQGSSLEDSERLPDEQIDGLLESRRAVATGVSLGLLMAGLDAMPTAVVANIKASSEALD